MGKWEKESGGDLAESSPPHGTTTSADRLLGDVREVIEAARLQTARAVNSSLVDLYWHIGKRIRESVLHEQRTGHGEEIMQTMSAKLVAEYGRGFSRSGLSRMMRFAEVFPDERIVAALSQQLSWSHFVEILPLDSQRKRDFYAEMCRVEGWSVRTLRYKIDHQLCERMAVDRQPEKAIEQDPDASGDGDRTTPDLVFRDPYFLEFLGLAGQDAEKDLERAILRELETFILELGSDFALVARRKRITVDSEDWYLDLLFYHRRLCCLVAIDLKLGKFKAADKGQMERYLRWLEKHDMRPGEDPPLGLILCADQSDEHIELLQLDERGIRVARYLTELPSRELLERKLRSAVLLARERLVQESPRDHSGSAPRPPAPPKPKAVRRKQTDK